MTQHELKARVEYARQVTAAANEARFQLAVRQALGLDENPAAHVETFRSLFLTTAHLAHPTQDDVDRAANAIQALSY